MRLPLLIFVPAAVALAAGCSVVNAPADPIANDGGGGPGAGGGGSDPGVVAEPDEVTTDEDTAIEISVLDNDSGEGLSLESFNDSGVTGAVSQMDNSIIYDPSGLLDHFGPADMLEETFTYTVMDGSGDTDTQTITVTVQGVNDAPVADDQMQVLNTEITMQLTGSDVDSATLTFEIDQPPSGGMLSNLMPVDGTSALVTFTPAPGFVGQDSFTFSVSDGVDTDTGTVSLEVQIPPLVLGAGSHTIDTDMGTVDGMTYPGFNGTAFVTSDFDVQVGATVVATGSQPLIVEASGNVFIDGILDVSGQDGSLHSGGCSGPPSVGGAGGPGGFAGGNGGGLSPGTGTENGGSGLGPGGAGGGIIGGQDQGYSDGGNAGHLTQGQPGVTTFGGMVGFGGPLYASLPPLIGGSGGGGSSVEKDSAAGMLNIGDDTGGAGGGGGGAVRLMAGVMLVVSGSIDASGGNGSQGSCSGSGGGGSGGSIDLAAAGMGPMVMGLLNVQGGTSANNQSQASVGRTLLTTLP